MLGSRMALCPIEHATGAQRIPIARPPDAGVHIERNLSVQNVERPKPILVSALLDDFDGFDDPLVGFDVGATQVVEAA